MTMVVLCVVDFVFLFANFCGPSLPPWPFPRYTFSPILNSYSEVVSIAFSFRIIIFPPTPTTTKENDIENHVPRCRRKELRIPGSFLPFSHPLSPWQPFLLLPVSQLIRPERPHSSCCVFSWESTSSCPEGWYIGLQGPTSGGDFLNVL